MKNKLRKKYLLKIFVLVLLFTIKTVGFKPMVANAASGDFSGVTNQKSGDLDWSITSEGHLTISGTGDYVKDAPYSAYTSYPSWFAYKDNILTAEVSVTGITDMSHMFIGLPNLTSVEFKNMNTSQVTDMKHMFSNCTSLKSVDLSSFDTQNVTNMAGMFNMCSSLQSVVVKGQNFKTSKVTDMNRMFSDCNRLQSLDLTGFDTGNVTNMTYMFYNCKKIPALDLSGFNTAKVTDMSVMFANCYKLQTLTLGSSFSVNKVKKMNSMFSSCQVLESIDLSSFKECKVTTTAAMFDNCAKLKKISFPTQFDTSNVTDMCAMFRSCPVLEEVDIRSFNTANVTKMNEMFNGCRALKELDVANFDTGNVQEIQYMFEKCKVLTTLDLSKFNTENVTSMTGMFKECSALQTLNISGFNTSNVKSMDSMFQDCTALQSIDVSRFDTSNVTNLAEMFHGCDSLKELDLSSFDTSSYTKDTEFELQLDNVLKITTGKDKRAYKFTTGSDFWYDDSNNFYSEDTAIEAEGNTTFYAHTGIFDINYIYDGELVDVQNSYDTRADLNLSGYVSNKNAVFEGWYEDEQLTKKITVIPAGRFSEPTLYAKMIPNTYTITYKNVDNITNKDKLTSSYTYGTKTSLVSPAKTCYLFDGWYMDEKYKQSLKEITKTTSGNLVLYAKWKTNHKLDKEHGVVIKKATTVSEGEIRYQCKNCDYTETEKIPRLVTDESQITDSTILDNPDDGDIKGSDFTKFQARASKTTKTSITLKWNKIKGADGYKIYGNKCGKKNKYEFLKNVKDGKKTTWKKSKCQKGRYYKFIVRAYKIVDGQEVTLAVSKTIHAATLGGKKGNAKAVKIKTNKKMKKSSSGYKLTLKKNKKYTIKASEVSGGNKINIHRKIRFESTNKSVATVSLKGVVKAKKTGTCVIYAYAQNGVYTKIKVVVK